MKNIMDSGTPPVEYSDTSSNKNVDKKKETETEVSYEVKFKSFAFEGRSYGNFRK